MAISKDKPMFPEPGTVDNFAHIWFMLVQKKINVLGSVKKNTNDTGKLPGRIIEFSDRYIIPAQAKSFLTRTGNYP
jgi:hypothetical protein